jgi:hypothetical protein
MLVYGTIVANIHMSSMIHLSRMCSYQFSIVPGHFVSLAEVAEASPGSKLTTQPNLGLNGPAHEEQSSLAMLPWIRFKSYVESLNRNSRPGDSYKVLYLVRHGLAVHNAIRLKVGVHAWDVGNHSLASISPTILHLLLTTGRITGLFLMEMMRLLG